MRWKQHLFVTWWRCWLRTVFCLFSCWQDSSCIFDFETTASSVSDGILNDSYFCSRSFSQIRFSLFPMGAENHVFVVFTDSLFLLTIYLFLVQNIYEKLNNTYLVVQKKRLTNDEKFHLSRASTAKNTKVQKCPINRLRLQICLSSQPFSSYELLQSRPCLLIWGLLWQ